MRVSYDFECQDLYDFECRDAYDYESWDLHDYECRNCMTTHVAAMTTNVGNYMTMNVAPRRRMCDRHFHMSRFTLIT